MIALSVHRVFTVQVQLYQKRTQENKSDTHTQNIGFTKQDVKRDSFRAKVVDHSSQEQEIDANDNVVTMETRTRASQNEAHILTDGSTVNVREHGSWVDIVSHDSPTPREFITKDLDKNSVIIELKSNGKIDPKETELNRYVKPDASNGRSAGRAVGLANGSAGVASDSAWTVANGSAVGVASDCAGSVANGSAVAVASGNAGGVATKVLANGKTASPANTRTKYPNSSASKKECTNQDSRKQPISRRASSGQPVKSQKGVAAHWCG